MSHNSVSGGTTTKLSEYGYTYDDLDRLRAIDNLGVGGVTRVALNYSYDQAGNLTSVTNTINGVADGTTAYKYDALDRTTQITQSGAGITNKRVKLSYNAVGQMETLQRLTGGTFNQTVATTTYAHNDPLNRLTQIQHANATGGILSSYAFNYDNGSRIRKVQNADGTFVNYNYAKNDELKQADYSSVARTDENYTYDANGNRTNMGYVTGTNNQLSSDGKYAYTYDDEGNLKTRTEIATNVTGTFNWDSRNRLTSVTDTAGLSVSYAYDAHNQRIAKTTEGMTTRYVYDRGNLALEFNGTATTPTVRYFYGTQVDQILAQDKGSGNVSWMVTDQLGSVRALVGNDGTVRNRYDYDAFGNVTSTMTNATDTSRYQYTGREFDGETGLYYYRARYYDSRNGRFIGQDPTGFGAGDGNLYRYVGNSPTNTTDPTGLHGFVGSQYREIKYVDKNGSHNTSNITSVITARKADPNTYIVSDKTKAAIIFSPTRTGSDVSTSARSKVPDRRTGDDAGHIVGAQLGGSGRDENNLFAQTRSGYNQNPQSTWRAFENAIRANIDKVQYDNNSKQCPPNTGHLSAVLTVNLKYQRPKPNATKLLRPIAVDASVVFISPFSFAASTIRPLLLLNP
ncbi:hypothetical protein C7B65_26655 [Phormidesmis priestleyi ULC007]|uniref:RHS repeat-associated core domain-containing protein n=1 Tax=Phormidesmis priestleyi ULC007 TaxID=1920490 RepID=A0A2T1D1I6_9CYAN|nr:RHS repeat-associated core domain-containing protein [Phormidesmis priestleyi]PSB14254.1 hypothetical protein C7B65_26655 [Phormidesmis priestleyi ULC007]